jgi:dihydroorotate dehydrogenase electron transfer subunit
VKEEIVRYIDLIKYIEFKGTNESINIDKLISKAFDILPESYKSELTNLTNDKKCSALIYKRISNLKSYNTFCFNILNILINKIGLKICYKNLKYFDETVVSIKVNGQSSIIQDKIITDNCAFILKNHDTNLIFSFGHQSIKNLQDLSNHIYSIDSNKYENIHIIIFKKYEELNEARQLNKANVYKRSFFTSFDKICEKAIEVDKASYEKIFSSRWDYVCSKPKCHNIANLQKIEVIDNVPVGIKESKLFKLTFKTEDSIDILPGQFMMISTTNKQKEKSKKNKPKILHSISSVKPTHYNDLDTKRVSYLKRPFGIYRTYYENFTYDCSSKLNLEKELAAILFTIKPNKFEILYKILNNGIGTNELTKLVKGDNVEILAPLGKIFDLREIIKEEIDEIHIVGGGVGIAPLIYLIQILKYFNIQVKAFIGIENYKTLTYFDTAVDPQSFTSTGRNAKIYVDDLKFLGLSEASDIYISFLNSTEEEQISDIKNVFKGCFITEPYSKYLKGNSNLKILTFTCGPMPMMHKVHNLTSQYNIKSYVLMEKRMACGIGVCFSCVCKTIVNGENHYSRVCIDGPIIESNKINWNE